MLERVLVMGCPWQPTRLMYASAGRARSGQRCLYTYGGNVRIVYGIRNPVGCTTRTTARVYNGKREVRFVCVHTRGRVN